MTPQEYAELRRRAGMTQRALARELSLHERTVARREEGQIKVTKEMALALSAVTARHSVKKFQLSN